MAWATKPEWLKNELLLGKKKKKGSDNSRKEACIRVVGIDHWKTNILVSQKPIGLLAAFDATAAIPRIAIAKITR